MESRGTARRLSVLFAMEHLGHLRNFENALDQLAERNHSVRVVSAAAGPLESALAEEIHRRRPTVTFEMEEPQPAGFVDTTWHKLAAGVRAGLDALRYSHRHYDHAPRLRARAAGFGPGLLGWLTQPTVLRQAGAARLLGRVLKRVEASLLPRATVQALFDRVKPDVAVLTPLVSFGSDQVDYVRAARARRIPTVLCVGSWDHLTTKGAIHEVPDRVLVWNEAQKREARELHGLPEDRVIVTGAHSYDHWLAWRPGPRADLCARAGLDPGRGFLLYMCSSPFIAPRERDFVLAWISRLRKHPRLRETSVLVRPHPQHAEQWRQADLGQKGAVAVWPPGGKNPLERDAKADYYDSIFHSLAVVGANTSGLVEAAIIGRPVYSVLASELAQGQGGTLHFDHLAGSDGMLTLARDLDEHVAQLDALLDAGAKAAPAERFLRSFVRPHGQASPAAPLLVQAIEDAAGLQPAPGTRSSASLRFLAFGTALALRPRYVLSAVREALRGRPLRESRPLAAKDGAHGR